MYTNGAAVDVRLRTLRERGDGAFIVGMDGRRGVRPPRPGHDRRGLISGRHGLVGRAHEVHAAVTFSFGFLFKRAFAVNPQARVTLMNLREASRSSDWSNRIGRNKSACLGLIMSFTLNVRTFLRLHAIACGLADQR